MPIESQLPHGPSDREQDRLQAEWEEERDRASLAAREMVEPSLDQEVPIPPEAVEAGITQAEWEAYQEALESPNANHRSTPSTIAREIFKEKTDAYTAALARSREQRSETTREPSYREVAAEPWEPAEVRRARAEQLRKQAQVFGEPRPEPPAPPTPDELAELMRDPAAEQRTPGDQQAA